MFKAAKRIERKPFENPVVHDKEGKKFTEPQQIHSIVKDPFRKQFFKDDQAVVERFFFERFLGPRRPLLLEHKFLVPFFVR